MTEQELLWVRAVVIISFVLILLFFPLMVFGDSFTNEEIANAIFKAEGGYKATYLYGIRSVPYEDEAEARRICLNTIRNQRKRHANHECDLTYLECLAKRYCPIGADNDPKGLNKHWLGNVKHFLNNPK